MAFVIPTIYTAVDRVSGTVTRMTANMDKFAASTNKAMGASSDDKPSGLVKKLKYLKELGEAMAVISTAAYTGKAIADYEAEINNLSAVTGVSGVELDKFKAIIAETAKETKRSSVDVAKSFTTIANAMPELLTNAEGLSKVTTAAITLAKASRMELQPAAAALTDILNQFNKSADYANSAIQIMAAGAKYGSAEIRDLQDSIIGFGKIADLSGVTFKESIGLVELVSKFKKGTYAGIELRNVLLEMNKNTAQDPKALADLRRLGVNIKLVADSTVPLADRLLELKKILHDSNAMNHVFGKENVAMGATVLDNAEKLKPLLANMDELGVATEMAAKNTSGLIAKAQMLRDSWVTWFTTSSTATAALNALSGVIGFVTDHLDGLMTIGTTVLGLYTAMKVRTWALALTTWGLAKAQTALAAVQTTLNFLMGIATVVTGEYATACFATTAGIRGMAFASYFLEAGLLGSLGVIGLVAAAVFTIANRFSVANDKANFLNGTLRATKDGFEQIVTPINNATAALLAYNGAVNEYNKKKQEQAAEKYEWRNHPYRMVWDKMFGHPIDQIMGNNNMMSATDSIQAPNIKDYKDYDSSQVQKAYLPPDTAPAHASNISTSRMEDLLRDIRDGINNNTGGRPGIGVYRTPSTRTA